MNTDFIRSNITAIHKDIQAAALRAGRNAEDIKLIAVTKTQTPEMINAAIDSGIDSIGENRAQELRDKADYLNLEGVDLHFIGQLQSNKVKYIIDKVKLIQSLDRLELAEVINRQAEQLGIHIPVLVEINVGGEASKGGIAPDDAESFIHSVEKLKFIKVKGLMTVAPLFTEPRAYFIIMRQLFESLKSNADMQYLSMGMSGDYQTAIEEGSNMIRLGSAIFGLR